MAARSGCRFTQHLFSQCSYCPRFELPCLCAAKRCHKPARVPWGTQQVRGFHDPGELGCWNKGDVTLPSSSNDYSILLVYHLVEHGGQVLAKAAIGRFTRHGIPDFIVQDSCTPPGFRKIANLAASMSW